MQADAVLSKQILSSDAQTADPGAIQLRPQVAVGDAPGRGFQIRCQRVGRGVFVCSHQHLGGLSSFEAQGEDHALYVGGCVGLNRLKLYGPSLGIAQPAIAPGVEAQERLRLDHAFPGSVIGVDDHDLLLVDRRQGAARPAPGDLYGDLLTGDSSPSLHGPHRIPGRRYRGASQDVVELGEQQVVPGAVEPAVELPSLLFVVYEALDEAPALVEQVLAALLLLLDVMHHAVASGEGVLQLLGYDRETISVLCNSVEEGLGGAEP